MVVSRVCLITLIATTGLSDRFRSKREVSTVDCTGQLNTLRQCMNDVRQMIEEKAKAQGTSSSEQEKLAFTRKICDMYNTLVECENSLDRECYKLDAKRAIDKAQEDTLTHSLADTGDWDPNKCAIARQYLSGATSHQSVQILIVLLVGVLVA